MYLEESPYQRDQLINVDQLIGRALDHGVELGQDHHKTIENFVGFGLLPRLLTGQFPATALDRLIFIDQQLKKGKSIEDIKKIIAEERKNFLKKPMDLSSLVDAYKGASKSLLMLASVGLIIFLLTSLFINLPDSAIKKSVSQPVGRVLAEFIKEAKPANSNSTDPLGLTNVSKIITVNEKQEVIIQKTLSSDPATANSTSNSLITNDTLTVDNIDVKNILSQTITFPNLSGSGNLCVLTLDLAQVLSCSSEQYWTALTIKDIADTSASTALAGLSISGSGITVSRTGNAFSLTAAVNDAITSVDGVKNNGSDIDLIAGGGVTITPNDTNNTITFSLSGSGVNADLLDSIDSTQFLRSDTSDNFTSGTLTFDAATTLSVLGTFTCTGCVADSAVADTITASNYLPLAGGTMAGNINLNNNLVINIGNAGTDFTSGGGLNIATDLDANGHGAFGSTGAVTSSAIVYFSESQSSDVIYSGLLVAPTSSFNGVGSPSTFGIRTLPIYSGADTGISLIGLDSIATYSGSGSATTLAALQATVSTGVGSGSVTTLVGLSIVSPSILGATPTNSYGLEVQDITVGSNIYPIYQSGTTGTNIFNAATNFGGKLSASTASSSAVGFNLNTAQAGPACASLSNGDFGFDSSNNRIYWKGTGGTCSYWNRTGTFDVAEHAPATEITEAGDILVIDTNSTTFAVKKSSAPYQRTVLGIESTDPTLVSNPDLLEPHNFVSKLALAGRVPTKVSTENGPISVGDYLTTSNTPGVAMKATSTGPTIGKALESYEGSGVGKVLVFVDNSFYVNLAEAPSYSLANGSYVETFVSKIGEAIFSKVTTAIASVGKLVFGELAVKKDSQSAGVGQIPAVQSEVFIQSNKIKSDSLINLTAVSEPDGILFVKSKTPGQGFVVGIKHLSSATNQAVDFNWLVINQEN